MTDDTDTTDDGSDASPDDAWTGDDERTGTDAEVEGDHDGTDAEAEAGHGGTVAAADGGHGGAATEVDGGDGSEAGPDRSSDSTAAVAGGRDVREYLLKGSLVLLVVLGVVATLQFYVHAQTAIGRLVSSDYRPLFLAGFNLVVLLAAGIGIAQVVRRLG